MMIYGKGIYKNVVVCGNRAYSSILLMSVILTDKNTLRIKNNSAKTSGPHFATA